MIETIDNFTYSGADITVYASIPGVVGEVPVIPQVEPSTTFSSLSIDGKEENPFTVDNSGTNKTIDGINKSYADRANLIPLGSLQTISYSIYRDKEQVKALGQVTPRGYTRGFITIAGTMIFTVFYQGVLAEVFSMLNGADSIHRVDQLPPIDLLIHFANESGNQSKLAIYGVEFMNEGQVMSIQDLMTENSVNYVARHITRMKSTDQLTTTNPQNSNTLSVDDYNTARLEIANQRFNY